MEPSVHNHDPDIMLWTLVLAITYIGRRKCIDTRFGFITQIARRNTWPCCHTTHLYTSSIRLIWTGFRIFPTRPLLWNNRRLLATTKKSLIDDAESYFCRAASPARRGVEERWHDGDTRGHCPDSRIFTYLHVCLSSGHRSIRFGADVMFNGDETERNGVDDVANVDSDASVHINWLEFVA